MPSSCRERERGGRRKGVNKGGGLQIGVDIGGGVKKCICEMNKSNVNQHTERIKVHRVLSINSMYSRSDSQKQDMMIFHRLGHNIGWQGG